jgi:hypothetical protein
MQFKPCLDSVDAFAEPGFTCKTLLSIQVFGKPQKLFLCSGFTTHTPFQECAEKVFFALADIEEKGFCQLHGTKRMGSVIFKAKELFKTDSAAVLDDQKI